MLRRLLSNLVARSSRSALLLFCLLAQVGCATKPFPLYDDHRSIVPATARVTIVTVVHIEIVYDLAGNRTQETWANGEVIAHSYDALTRIDTAGTTSTVPDALNRIVQVTPPNGGTTQTIYTPAGRVQSVTTPNGLVSTTTYDQAGRIVTLMHRQNTAPVASYTYRYDANSIWTRDYASDAGHCRNLRAGTSKT